MAWVVKFKVFLKESIDFFFETIAKPGKPPRTHPLLLSLMEAISKSRNAPDISSVLEDDPSALRGNYYTAPNDLPPLDIHFHGQHAYIASFLPRMYGFSTARVFSRGINTPLAVPDLDTNASHPQDHAAVALSMPSAALNLCTDTSQAQECSAVASSATSNMPRREKHRKMQEVTKIKAARLQENAKGRFANKIGFPKVKGMNGKVRRKWVKKTRSKPHDTWEDEPVPSEESQNETGEAQGEDDNKTIKELKMEVEALKSRCNGYEREIRDLQGTCDTHEKVLEMLRQQIMRLMDAQGILNTTYGGKSYVLIP
ncbi:hypothetical protein EI94DRAFT_1704764 [Lactarius quietus]|nr:hypothetical protein EI94DRAFT_1704764 [Lactarius quietus]